MKVGRYARLFVSFVLMMPFVVIPQGQACSVTVKHASGEAVHDGGDSRLATVARGWPPYSLELPRLYNHRPPSDIVMVMLLLGGTALCVTSLVLTYRIVARNARVVTRWFPADRPPLDVAHSPSTEESARTGQRFFYNRSGLNRPRADR